MKNLVSSVVVMLLAALVGFAAVHAAFRTTRRGGPGAVETLVLEVDVKDTRGKPLRGAAVVRREAGKTIPIGRTDERGRVRGRLPREVLAAKGSAVRVVASKRGYVTTVSVVRPASDASSRGSRLFAPAGPVRASVLLPRAVARTKRSPAPRAHSARVGSIAVATARARSFPISVISGAASDRPVAAAIGARLSRVASSHGARLPREGVASLQVRMLWNEASYVEILAVTAQGRSLAGVLLPARATDDASLAAALRDMIPRLSSAAPHGARTPRSDKGGLQRTLTVSTTRPSEARAYLDGRPLMRRIVGGSAIFFVPSTFNARRASDGGARASAPTHGSGRELTLTSDNGPLIRSVLPASGLRSDIRWTLPDAALSRR